MILAIDFDRVIHDTDHPKPGRRMGLPMPGALEAFRSLVDNGHTVFVHTCMAQTEPGAQAVRDWLSFYGFHPLPEIVAKPTADVYIDDRALEFESWPETMWSLGPLVKT